METGILSLHDHLFHSIGGQELTGIFLLDLSAAFETIDHAILLHCLNSWFGIDGSALSWIKSYLFSRTVTVSALGQSSSSFPVNHGIPRGSVLEPLLFTRYTTVLSTLISSTHVDQHLQADDTQLHISFKLQRCCFTSVYLLSSVQMDGSQPPSSQLIQNRISDHLAARNSSPNSQHFRNHW